MATYVLIPGAGSDSSYWRSRSAASPLPWWANTGQSAARARQAELDGRAPIRGR
ncbi:MAG: hypothetical protein U0Q22_16940 [Acidimicrobiales bacterium]